mmetsp:Transcript_14717/g.20447  ORF Transcript_14717/g.20447 Transcript_14717/m.20447 type:complete len:181 (-) Transcript_14717:106-648(-)
MWCFRERNSRSSNTHNQKQEHIELHQQSAAETQCESDLDLKVPARSSSAPEESKIELNADHMTINTPKGLQCTAIELQVEINKTRCDIHKDEGCHQNKSEEEKAVSPAEEEVKRELPVKEPDSEKAIEERNVKIYVASLENETGLTTNRSIESCSRSSESSGDGLGSPVIIEIPDVLVQT